MLFRDLALEWLAGKKSYVKESTYALYQYEIENYLLPALGHMCIADLNEQFLQEAVLNWQNESGGSRRAMKKSTVQNLVILLKQIARYAMKKDYIKQSKIDIRYAPQKSIQCSRKILEEEEQLRLISAVLADLTPETLGILLCINSGLRIGELCALKWSDVNISERILHVTKTMQRIYLKNSNPKSYVVITGPKTESSVRDIPLSEKMCELIAEVGDMNPQHYILTNSERYIEPRTYRKHYNVFLHMQGISHIKFHSLRHTFATKCIESGADYRVVSEILGHSTINTTLNMYVHPQMSQKRKCIESICWRRTNESQI